MNTRTEAPGRSSTNDSDRPVQELVEAYWDRVCRYAMYLGASAADAEDIAQETFLKACRAADRFTCGSSFQAWILRIAGNCYVDWTRRRAARNTATSRKTAGQALEPAPSQTVETREIESAVRSALALLSEKERAVFLMKVHEDMAHREIAETLGTSEEAVRWHMYAARKKLRELLADYV
ncbi:MAG: sigma-70 family RNA polymerase sigma factor [Planctomycetes bacterium]|nr:sigma-70 family RNA polymerase sigma factor [Planctomycetota bacterium]